MKQSFLHRLARRFRGEQDGSVMVETVICLPLLIWGVVASYEFFEVHRYKSAREKATYTVADMLSRESSSVNDVYVDNAMTLFDTISNDAGVNQLRVSVVMYDQDADEYSIWWSETRGDGGMLELQDADVKTAHAVLPILNDGEQLILVESESDYRPTFNVGLGSKVEVATRIFTKIRFQSQLCHADHNPHCSAGT